MFKAANFSDNDTCQHYVLHVILCYRYHQMATITSRQTRNRLERSTSGYPAFRQRLLNGIPGIYSI